MSAELGKVDRPDAGQFKKSKKLYLVPLVFCPEGAPADYAEICGRYWEGVKSGLESLEGRIGGVKHVYHESISWGGEQGLEFVKKVSQKSYELAGPRCTGGAVFEALEDDETLREHMDWQRCASVGLVSQKAARVVGENYMEAVKRRFDHMAKLISETLSPEEAGLLFISEDHKIQFPAEVEVFYVAPPALDEVRRWLRSHAHDHEPEEEHRQEQERG